MYCNKCGKAVRSDDVYCSFCGNKLNRLNYDFGNEEIVYNMPSPRGHREDRAKVPTMFKGSEIEKEIIEPERENPVSPVSEKSSEFVWDVKDFEVPSNKTDAYAVDWKKLQIYEKEKKDSSAAPNGFVAMAEEFTGESYDEPVHSTGPSFHEQEMSQIFRKKAEREASFVDRETANPFGTAIDAFKDEHAVSIEDIQRDIDKDHSDASRDAAKIEKFYTFNQKNEEFQKLLDREYERVNKGRGVETTDEEVPSGVSLESLIEANRPVKIPVAEASSDEQLGEPQQVIVPETPSKDLQASDFSSKGGGFALRAAADEAAARVARLAATPVPEAAVIEAHAKAAHVAAGVAAAKMAVARAEEDASVTDETIRVPATKEVQEDIKVQQMETEKKPVESEPEITAGAESRSREDWSNLGVFDPEAQLKKAEEAREAAVIMAPDVYDNESLIRRFDTRELEKDVLEMEIEKERKLREKQRKAAEYEERERILDELYGKREEQGKVVAPTPVWTQELAVPQTEEAAGVDLEADIEEGVFILENQQEAAHTSGEAFVEEAKEESTEKINVAAEEKHEEQALAEKGIEASEALLASDEVIHTENHEPGDLTEERVGTTENLKGTYQEIEAEKEETEIDKLKLLDELQGNERTVFGEEVKEKKSAGQVLLNLVIAVAAICLVAEIAVAGIVHFMPNSEAAEFLEDKIGPLVIRFGDEPIEEKEEEIEEPVIPEGTPLAVEELVEHAKNFNDNIKELKADSTMGFLPTIEYKESKIAKSSPLENNIWYRDLNGNAVYVDKCVVDTLVKYNSQWIDYANKGDEKVFELLKKDAPLYKSCKSLKNPGKLDKTFDELKVGQVRATEGGYLVWAHEVISGNNNGKSESATYDCVYFLSDTNYILQIEDCYQL